MINSLSLITQGHNKMDADESHTLLRGLAGAQGKYYHLLCEATKEILLPKR